MQDCSFLNNSGTYGGGLSASIGGPVTIRGCRFIANQATNGGGGAYVYGQNAPMDFNNCVFYGNSVSGQGSSGGGLLAGGGNANLSLSNCTFAANSSLAGGGHGSAAAFNGNNMTTGLSNCIAWDGANSGFVDELYFYPSVQALSSVIYSDVQGGYAGEGNIDADPLFVSRFLGDLHLQPFSPCAGSGTVTTSPLADLDGIVRPNPPSMGAYDVPMVFGGVTLTRTKLAGGESTTGTVSINRPAPQGGLLVALASNTGYARVPDSILIPAGQRSATFNLVSRPVADLKAATVTATALNTPLSASLLIAAPVLQSVTLDASSVVGGRQNVTGTVTLGSVAPTGGTRVTLSSNTGYAQVAESVLVPAGYKTVSFTVLTKRVTANKDVNIRAAQGSNVKNAGLILTP